MPLNMFVYPVLPDAALPDVFTKYAVVPATSLSLPPRRTSPPTATSGSTSGPTSCCASGAGPSGTAATAPAVAVPRLAAVGPGRRARRRSSRVFFVWPVATIIGRGLSLGAIADVLTDPGLRVGGVVHALAGRRSAPSLTVRRGPARRLRHGALPLPRPAGRAGRRDRAVRAADGRGRRGVPGPAARPLPRHGVGHRRRPRVLQLRRRRPHRQHAVGPPRSRGSRRRPGCSARRGWRAFREVTLAAAAAGDHGGGVDRVPVHLHVVRRRCCILGGPAPPHARGRDLPPDDPGARPVAPPPRSPSCSWSP